MKNKSPKIALVHDYLRDYGGAERVLQALHDMYPQAPVYVAFRDEKALGMHAKQFADWDIRESWLTEIPFYKKLFSPLRIWAPYYFRAFDLSDFDVVISSSNAYFAKAVRVRRQDPSGRPDAVHICYCHTPARSLYGYSTMTDWHNRPLIHAFGTLINHYLRVIDVKVAQEVDYFIANSQETARRIQKFYRRDATVIFPPVRVPASWAEVEKLRAHAREKYGEYFLYVNRLAFAKHPELAMQTCAKLQLPLKVVGSGKLQTELEKFTRPNIHLLGAVNDEQLAELYAGATALLYPVEDEDFGMIPIEAMSYGVPVIAHRSGGPRETIIEGQTGIFFDELTTKGVTEAIQKFISLNKKKKSFDEYDIFKNAQQYSVKAFQEKMRNFVITHAIEEKN